MVDRHQLADCLDDGVVAVAEIVRASPGISTDAVEEAWISRKGAEPKLEIWEVLDRACACGFINAIVETRTVSFYPV